MATDSTVTPSYDPSLPTDRDWVRFVVGDRDPATAKLRDSEIDALLVEEGNKYLAAARAGEIILAQNRGIASKSVGELSISYGDSPQSSYRDHLTRLRQEGNRLLLRLNGDAAVFGNL